MLEKDKNLLSESIPSHWIDNNKFDYSYMTKNLKPHFYKENEVIYNQDDITDCVYLVQKGRICLSVLSNSGKKKSFFIAEEGCIFGELSAIDNQPNFCSSIAVADSYIYEIQKNLFINELSLNNELCLEVLRLLVIKMRLMATQVEQLSFHDSQYKVYYAILNLINQHSLHSSDNYYLTIKFTHQEMADLTGLSRVTVSQIMSDLIKKGILDKQGSHLVVKNLGPIINYVASNE